MDCTWRCHKVIGGIRLCDVWVCLAQINQCSENKNVEEDGWGRWGLGCKIESWFVSFSALPWRIVYSHLEKLSSFNMLQAWFLYNGFLWKLLVCDFFIRIISMWWFLWELLVCDRFSYELLACDGFSYELLVCGGFYTYFCF